jgi:hypothetical protein
LGAIGGAAGPLLGAAIRAVTSSGAGAAAISAVRTGISNVLNRTPSFRPSPVSVRPQAAPGGGAVRPAGSPSNNAASCAIGNSFAPATLVLMADGSTEPIEHIELGDEVWAADPETGEAGARPVTALIEGEGVKDLVTVSTGSGSVVATVGHPFWSVSDAAWVDAGDLSVGDAVLQADGATSVVTQVVEVSRPAVVHNLTVADLHTYFVVVGDAPTLVHNCSGADDGIVYLRTDANGGKPYVGQSKSETRFDARQGEHQRDNPGALFEYEELGRAEPGVALDRLEEAWILRLGGPSTRRNPDGGLANLRHQMNPTRYEEAGGDPW